MNILWYQAPYFLDKFCVYATNKKVFICLRVFIFVVTRPISAYILFFCFKKMSDNVAHFIFDYINVIYKKYFCD